MAKGPKHVRGQRTLWDRFTRPTTRTHNTTPTTIQPTHNTHTRSTNPNEEPDQQASSQPPTPQRRGNNHSRVTQAPRFARKKKRSPRRNQRTRLPRLTPREHRHQTTLDGSVGRLEDGEDWGDHLRATKPKQCLRLIGGNLKGLPVYGLDPGGKMTDLCQTLTDLNCNCNLITITKLRYV